MTEVLNQRSGSRPKARLWRAASGITVVAAAALLTPSLAMAATGGAQGTAAARPAAVVPGEPESWGNMVALGDGSDNEDAVNPAPVDAVVNVSQMTGGCRHGVALGAAGQVLAWGDGTRGQLGDGKTDTALSAQVVPFQQPGVTIASVAAGCSYSLALSSQGQVLAWGDNRAGQLGIGFPGGFRTSPVQVRLPRGVQAAAISAGSDFALALTTTGQVYAWGDDAQGQLGDGRFHFLSPVPVLVRTPRGLRVTAVSAGGAHALALTSAGLLLGWGSNRHGQLGNGFLRQARTPFPIRLGGARATAISAGGAHSLAVADAGRTLLAWGDNRHGQLGDGTTVSRFRPAPVRLGLPAGVTVAAIGAGAVHSIALTSEPLVLTWGGNAFGQLGDDSKTDRALPVQPNLFEVLNGVRQPERVTVIGTGPASMNSFAAVPPRP